MKIWNAFAESRRVRLICFGLATALLLASIIGLGVSAGAPGLEAPTAGYEHRGQFDYTVYLKPNILYGNVVLTGEEEEEKPPMLFFRDIIKEIDLSFSYSFDSRQAANVTNTVVISVIAENPGVWQKEFTRLERTPTGKEFKVSFPLDLSSLEKVVADIEEEIGITTTQRNYIIRAVVTTSAETAGGQAITERFSHDINAVVTTRRLELKGDLEGSREGYVEGISYEANGRFDYEISLMPNKLYETDVLKSQPPPVTPPPPGHTLGPGLVYFPRMIDDISARFSYQFLCEIPIAEQSQEVEVTATIENPGKWSRTLVLLPKTGKTGSFTTSFPIDIRYFTMVIDAIGQETGARGTSHKITIRAEVRTMAQTDAGTIDEVFTQTLAGTLEANSLTFDKELSRSQPGIITGTAADLAAGEERSRTPWIVMLIIALLALGYFGWSQSRLGMAAVTADEAEVARAGKKYKQMMLDVRALPKAKASDTVVPMSSVDDLVRIGDDLVKPVLHEVDAGRHSYCVIDGSVRYLRVIETQQRGQKTPRAEAPSDMAGHVSDAEDAEALR